jgi:hypothetical protein
MSYAHFVYLLFSFQRPNQLRDLQFLVPVASGAVFLLHCFRTVKKNFEEFFFQSVPRSAYCSVSGAPYLAAPCYSVNRFFQPGCRFAVRLFPGSARAPYLAPSCCLVNRKSFFSIFRVCRPSTSRFGEGALLSPLLLPRQPKKFLFDFPSLPSVEFPSGEGAVSSNPALPRQPKISRRLIFLSEGPFHEESREGRGFI